MMLAFTQATAVDFSMLLAQASIGSIVCVVVARLYIALSKSWPLKIRGSGVGIISLLLILIFSSISVYKPFGVSSQDRLEFRQLYHW